VKVKHTWETNVNELNTCKHIAMLTLHPKEVETARGLKPRGAKSLEKLLVRLILGRSSATTTHVRTQARLTFRCFRRLTEEPRPLVHNSITPYEQNVSRTLYWLTALSQRLGFTSTSDGGIKIEWWPEYTLYNGGNNASLNKVTWSLIGIISFNNTNLLKHHKANPSPQ